MRSSAWLVLGLFACGPIPPDPIIDPPVNECISTADCAEGSCREHQLPNPGRHCEVDEEIDFVLVLPMPDTVLYAPNVTYLLTQTELQQPSFPSDTCKGNCVSVPSLARTEGRYVVTRDVAHALGARLPIGDNGEEAAQAQIPVRASYRRLVPSASGELVEASSVGLPVEPIFANRILDNGPDPSGIVGIGGQPPLLTTANLPPGDYLAEFQVDAPLQTLIPPRANRFSIAARRGTFVRLDTVTLNELDQRALRHGPIRSQYRALDDFRVSLVDRGTGRAISRTAVLQGQADELQLDTFNQTMAPDDPRLPNAELVIAPPSETYSGVPTLRTQLIDGSVRSYEYPELPLPSILDAKVVTADGRGVRADLEIVSTGIVNLREHVPEDTLSYSTKLSTDDRGAFRSVLPEGEYRVFVDPDPDENLTRREITLKTIGAESRNPVGARTEWTIPLGPKTRVSGRAVLQDQRVLERAEISFVPSIVRPSRSRFELPRPRTVSTEAGGVFTVDLDVGSYDVTVTPITGTRFAPYVVSDLFVRPPSSVPCQLDDFVVKVPKAYPLTLREPNDNLLPWAWARVFARAEGSQHYVEIQRELLDAEGYVDLWFRKPELAKTNPCG